MKIPYRRIELHLPNFGGWSLECGDRTVGVHIEDSDEAVEGSGRGDDAGWMSCDGYDAEAVAGIGELELELVGSPQPDSLVESAGKEEWRPVMCLGHPGGSPYGLFVGVLDGF